MIPIAPWLSSDTQGISDMIPKGETAVKFAKYGLAAGAGLALLAPNRFKVIGIAAAALAGVVLVANASPQTTATATPT